MKQSSYEETENLAQVTTSTRQKTFPRLMNVHSLVIVDIENVSNGYLGEVYPLRRWINIYAVLRRNADA